jgi:hypothetical protein
MGIVLSPRRKSVGDPPRTTISNGVMRRTNLRAYASPRANGAPKAEFTRRSRIPMGRMYTAIFFQACFRFRIDEAAENKIITPIICIVGAPKRATTKKKRMKHNDVKG